MRSCLLQFQGDHEGGQNAIEWQRCDVAMYLISGHDIVKDATSVQFSMGKVWREFLPALLVMVVYRDYKPIQCSLGKFVLKMPTFLTYQLAKEKVKKIVLLRSEACQKGNQHKMGQICI